MPEKINAEFILNLLMQKHCDDVAIPECKDGPTVGGYKRMDLWVMKKSWSKPSHICYEIKISRSDFLGDKKMLDYHTYCNQLVLVCPSGMVKPEEVHPSMGLMYCNPDKKSLFTKIKAPATQRDIPDSVYRYALMSRASIDVFGDQKRFNRARRIEYYMKTCGIRKTMETCGLKISNRLLNTLKSLSPIDYGHGNSRGLTGLLNDMKGKI